MWLVYKEGEGEGRERERRGSKVYMDGTVVNRGFSSFLT
jgi:hypothetical protein